jgi:hypothetical protein
LEKGFEEGIMGEAKRRKEQMGEQYGQPQTSLAGSLFSKGNTEKFVKWTTRGSWVGIGLVAVAWLVIRFVGPSFGWWQVN